jgi:hypothetical protein
VLLQHVDGVIEPFLVEEGLRGNDARGIGIEGLTCFDTRLDSALKVRARRLVATAFVEGPLLEAASYTHTASQPVLVDDRLRIAQCEGKLANIGIKLCGVHLGLLEGGLVRHLRKQLQNGAQPGKGFLVAL